MRAKLKRGIILSAELSTLTRHDNEQRTRELYYELEQAGLRFKPVIGWYKGVQEKSFFVEIDGHGEALDTVYPLFKRFGQESLLFLNERREASLVYNDFSTGSLGKFVNVSAAEAAKHDASTYCPKLDQYWICK